MIPPHLISWNDDFLSYFATQFDLTRSLHKENEQAWKLWLSTFSASPLNVVTKEFFPMQTMASLKQFLNINEGKGIEMKRINFIMEKLLEKERFDIYEVLQINLGRERSENEIIPFQNLIFGTYPSLYLFLQMYFYAHAVFSYSKSVISSTAESSVKYFFEMLSRTLHRLRQSKEFSRYFHILHGSVKTKEEFFESIHRCINELKEDVISTFPYTITSDKFQFDKIEYSNFCRNVFLSLCYQEDITTEFAFKVFESLSF